VVGAGSRDPASSASRTFRARQVRVIPNLASALKAMGPDATARAVPSPPGSGTAVAADSPRPTAHPGTTSSSAPSRRRRGRRAHTDSDLAVADLAQRAGVLPRHPGGGVTVLGEPGVIQHPRRRIDQIDALLSAAQFARALRKKVAKQLADMRESGVARALLQGWIQPVALAVTRTSPENGAATAGNEQLRDDDADRSGSAVAEGAATGPEIREICERTPRSAGVPLLKVHGHTHEICYQ
jgi:hypothetical protein